MTLSSNLMAFALMFFIAMLIILPLSAVTIWIVPATKVYMMVSALPTVLYTTKILLEWNTREL